MSTVSNNDDSGITLEFENARAVEALYARDERLIKKLESELRVRVISREGWLRIEGGKDDVERARKVFEELDNVRRRGAPIGKHEFHYALNAVSHAEPLGDLLSGRIQCSSKKAPIVPKTKGQLRYVNTIHSHDLSFGMGPAGTGKTYLAMACAVAALKQEKVSRIVLTRPAVEAGEALGFLPGDLQEKILPYLRPLYDALYDMLEIDEIQRYMDRGVVEIAPLAYMRGRTLSNSFVILDEAQNTTTEQMFMFLTRLGTDSKCVVTGDPTQIDLPRNKQSGLVEAMHALKGINDIAFCMFEEVDVVRHPLVQAIIHAYRTYRDPSALEAGPDGLANNNR